MSEEASRCAGYCLSVAGLQLCYQYRRLERHRAVQGARDQADPLRFLEHCSHTLAVFFAMNGHFRAPGGFGEPESSLQLLDLPSMAPRPCRILASMPKALLP